jgi:hypothetical protein
MHSTRAVRTAHAWKKGNLLLGFILFFGVIYGAAFGCREWCWEMPETEVGFGTACWLRTYFLLPCVIAFLPQIVFLEDPFLAVRAFLAESAEPRGEWREARRGERGEEKGRGGRGEGERGERREERAEAGELRGGERRAEREERRGRRKYGLCHTFLKFLSLMPRAIYYAFMTGVFVVVPLLWINLVLLYPPILLADLNHYVVSHSPLADLAGDPARGILLTDHESVRVAWELISETSRRCVQRGGGKGADGRKMCWQYSRTCIAPLVNAAEFPVGSAAVGTLINSAYNNLDAAGEPAIQITAWAACELSADDIRNYTDRTQGRAYEAHCNQLATRTGNVTRWVQHARCCCTSCSCTSCS